MLLFCDGMDHYNAVQAGNKWDQGSGMSYSTTYGRFGQGCLYSIQSSGGATAAKSLPPGNVFIMGFAFKCTNKFPGSDADIISLRNGPNKQCSLILTNGGQLAVYGSSKLGSNSVSSIALNIWNFVEWKIAITSSTSAGQCVVNVNNTTWLNLVSVNTNAVSGTTNADSVVMGRITYDDFQPMYDDFYICDNQGTYNNDFLGDCRIETLYPKGAGSHTTFGLNGAATNWQAVSEVPADDDTSYVSTDTPGNIDSYDFTAPGGTVNTVFAIQAVMRARKDNAGARTFARSVRLGGTDFIGSAYSLGTDYGFYRDVMETNPNTSAPWSSSDVAALEGGVKLVS